MSDWIKFDIDNEETWPPISEDDSEVLGCFSSIDVNVCNKHGERWTTFFSAGENFKVWDIGDNVTHWALLPELPNNR